MCWLDYKASCSEQPTFNLKIMQMQMQMQKNRGYLKILVLGLVAIFPMIVGTVEHGASTIFTLLVLISLPGARTRWKSLDAEERRVFYAFIIFFAACVLSFVNVDDWDQTMKRLERLIRFLFIIPVYLLLRNLDKDILKPFSWGIALSGMVMLAVALYQVDIHYGQASARASGAYHPVLYGEFTMLSASVGLVLLGGKPESNWLKLALFVGVLSAIYASVLSGTRSAWIALPFVLMLLGWNYIITRKSSKLTLKLIAKAIVILLGTVLFILSNDYINHRVTQAKTEIVDFVQGRNKNSSIGDRLMMWENATRIWLRHPILGTGLGDYLGDNREMIEKGETELKNAYGAAHSIYFEYLATTGIIGLIAMFMAIIFIPIRFFWRHLRTIKKSNARSIALAGIVVPMNFAIYGLAQTWTAHSPAVTSFLITLVVVMAMLKNIRQTDSS